MIKLRYRCDGFAPSYGSLFQGTHTFNLEWNDLVWAAVSVGKLGYDDLMGYGYYSLDEIRFRTYLVYSHLMQHDNRICKSPLYESLDSTEKGAASYFIGMAVSKVIGLYLFNIPWLVHLEKIKLLYSIGTQGKSRPDLLGLDPSGKWIVFEAKGRSQGFSRYAIDQAKAQTGKILHISGSVPILRVATESYFTPYLNVYIADPEKSNNEAIKIEINEMQFFNSYYSTLSELMQMSPREETVQNQQCLFVDYESAGISIGMTQYVINRLKYNELQRGDLIRISTEKFSRTDKRTTKVYPDGIAVSLDNKRWSSDVMSLHPPERI